MAKEYPSVPILWKMAALMELCPADVQDMVYQTIDDVHEDYERLKQKILSWVSNKMSIRSGRVPMDIGRVDGGDSTFEVNAIGNSSQCYNCGGWRHASRECPSDRGAKGGKAKGKVNRLDKGVGKGGKGGGDGGTKGKGRGTKARATRVAKLDTRLGSAAHATSTQSRKQVRERWRRWWTLERSGTWGTWRLSM